MKKIIDSNSVKELMAYQIRMTRMMRGYTQQEIADKLHKSLNAVSQWELGNTSPPIDDLIELCKIYEVTPNQLCGWDENNELNDFIKKTEDAASKLEELKKRKREIEQEIKLCSEIINHKR